MFPPSEIAVGLVKIAADHLGATEDELILAVSRLLGFKATSAQLRTAIASLVVQLLKEGRFERQGTMLAVRTAARAPELAEQLTVEDAGGKNVGVGIARHAVLGDWPKAELLFLLNGQG